MTFLDLPRVPRSDSLSFEESAAKDADPNALRALEALDDAFVDAALTLGPQKGVVLDLGTGPGQVAIKLALQNSHFVIHGIDPSDALLRKAAFEAQRWGVSMRILLNRGDIPTQFRSAQFDMVLCNLVLHASPDPVGLIQEMSRVCKSGGALLLRDFRRPGRWEYGSYLRRHGRHYRARLGESFESSVRAAYTLKELRELVRQAGVRAAEIRRVKGGLIGFHCRSHTA